MDVGDWISMLTTSFEWWCLTLLLKHRLCYKVDIGDQNPPPTSMPPTADVKKCWWQNSLSKRYVQNILLRSCGITCHHCVLSLVTTYNVPWNVWFLIKTSKFSQKIHIILYNKLFHKSCSFNVRWGLRLLHKSNSIYSNNKRTIMSYS